MKRWLLLAALLATGCKKHRVDAGGVQAATTPEAKVLELTRGDLSVVYRAGEGAQAGGRLEVRKGTVHAAPVVVDLRVDGDEAAVIERRVDVDNGVAVLREKLRGDVVLTILAADDGAALRLVGPSGRRAVMALRLARSFDLTLDRGAPLPPGPLVPSTKTAYFALDGGSSHLVTAGRPALDVAAASQIVATTGVDGDRAIDLWVGLALVPDLRTALARGAALAGVPARSSAAIAMEPRDPTTTAFLAARLYAEGPAGAPPIVLDPIRESEPTMPIVDLTTPRMVLPLTPGRWTLRATRGPGFGVGKRIVDVKEGDALRVPLDLMPEGAVREHTVACDLHVHARPSFDAKRVSYEDRVRSLVAVGIECAAATEHDAVGDHGPAAAALGLDLRAMKVVELTTLSPAFGHFNVYPWPDGAPIPKTKATLPTTLFDAMHALPGEHVIQVNHPRALLQDGSTIGYFEAQAVDKKTGTTPAKGFRRDYDAIELFNGFDLDRPAAVHALIEEWITMLDRGEVHTATGSSDSHKLTVPWAGFPRTMVEVGPEFRPSGRPIAAIVAALKAGKAWVTSGPIVDVHVGEAGLGGAVKAPSKARVVVHPSSWQSAPRVWVRLGPKVIADATLALDPLRGYALEVPVPEVDKRTALVVVVETEVVGDGVGLFGFRRAIAFTNPVWIDPRSKP
ncbi:MAG: CehA/McbA family metallohydrolase [Myxococcales bacterium]|nr:CehA/McbA family metallohydrolase [Myxococcales bacterium]